MCIEKLTIQSVRTDILQWQLKPSIRQSVDLITTGVLLCTPFSSDIYFNSLNMHSLPYYSESHRKYNYQ